MSAQTPVMRAAQLVRDTERGLMLVVGRVEAYPEQQFAPDDLVTLQKALRDVQEASEELQRAWKLVAPE